MAQMVSKWRFVMGTIINYIFNPNNLYLLSNIYVYTLFDVQVNVHRDKFL